MEGYRRRILDLKKGIKETEHKMMKEEEGTRKMEDQLKKNIREEEVCLKTP